MKQAVQMGSDNDISFIWAPGMYLAYGATDPIYENRLVFYWEKSIKWEKYKFNIFINKCRKMWE